jgi:RNA polymerase sigma-70 factor, ECF subfamily
MGKTPAVTAAATRTGGVSDETLVRRTLAGDLTAFEQLVERHRAVLRRVAARIVGEDEADDVAQDAFLRAFHRLGRFRGDSGFRAWLLRIAHNAALDALSRRRSRALEDEDQAEGEAPIAEPRTPAEQLEVRERRERLAAKLRLMQPTHRIVLVLRDLEGLSYEEIADITESPLGSVKGRLHRARRELIEILRANTYDWELPA